MITVDGGGHHDLVLEISDRPLRGEPPDPAALWRATETGWHDAMPKIEGTIADRDARHAYAVLRGMTSQTGGMVAAATMGLPERAEAGRNYDYRYAWIRIRHTPSQAVAALGPHALLDESVAFVAERLSADGARLRPAYTVGGGVVPGERSVDVPGYPGACPRA